MWTTTISQVVVHVHIYFMIHMNVCTTHRYLQKEKGGSKKQEHFFLFPLWCRFHAVVFFFSRHSTSSTTKIVFTCKPLRSFLLVQLPPFPPRLPLFVLLLSVCPSQRLRWCPPSLWYPSSACYPHLSRRRVFLIHSLPFLFSIPPPIQKKT